MLTYYPRYAPGQDLLLSSSLSDWLLESHLAYSISGVIDEFDIHEFLFAL